MSSNHLRAIILKLEDRLSDNDRKCLHFFLGNDVPRRLRDDPSLSSNRSLMESLFDQDKINEQDFTFLINSFDQIQWTDAVKLLKGDSLCLINVSLFIVDIEHKGTMQANNDTDQSVPSLASIMPLTIEQILDDQTEGKYATAIGEWQMFYSFDLVRVTSFNLGSLTEQKDRDENNKMTINSNNKNIDLRTTIANNKTLLPPRPQSKQLFTVPATTLKWLLLYALLLMISLGIVIAVCVYQIHRLKNRLQKQDKRIQQLNILRSEDNRTIQQLTDRLTMLNLNGKINSICPH
jgi:hypothetical protein